MIIKPDLFTHSTIKALQTTRIGGSSVKPYNENNCGVFGFDENAENNLKSLKSSYDLPHNPVFLDQVHSNQVEEYKKVPQTHGLIKADACFTKETNLICAVLTADCLPVLITDSNSSIVAAIHCGWRGLYANILKATLAKMNVSNESLLCWLGPCISYKPYRVDEKFREKFVTKDPQLAHCFYRNKKGGWHADLKKIALTQLQQLGVKNITQSPYCTFDNKNLFYSYRREGETGRMASMIWLDK